MFIFNKLKNEKQKKPSCGSCCTRINNLNVSILNKDILSNINIHIHCGELTIIMGQNGAGKTTLLKAILNHIKHSGNIMFTDKKTNEIRIPKIGYVPQNIIIPKSIPIKVKELFNISLNKNTFIFLKKISENNSLFKDTDITSLLNKSLSELSYGELQKVFLVLALIPLPDILLLDEAFSNLDTNTRIKFYELLNYLKKEYDLTIILVSHYFDEIKNYADRIIIINKQILACENPKKIQENFANLLKTENLI